jgi:hypothetical protein
MANTFIKPDDVVKMFAEMIDRVSKGEDVSPDVVAHMIAKISNGMDVEDTSRTGADRGDE